MQKPDGRGGLSDLQWPSTQLCGRMCTATHRETVLDVANRAIVAVRNEAGDPLPAAGLAASGCPVAAVL